MAEVVKQFAEDFGFDLDKEGHPLEVGAPEPPRAVLPQPVEEKEEQAALVQ